MRHPPDMARVRYGEHQVAIGTQIVGSRLVSIYLSNYLTVRACAQPKKQANGSASTSRTRSPIRSFDDCPGYSCHFRSARCQ